MKEREKEMEKEREKLKGAREREKEKERERWVPCSWLTAFCVVAAGYVRFFKCVWVKVCRIGGGGGVCIACCLGECECVCV